MALTGLEIYKQLPKTNCKDCGFPTCLAFAMKMAAKQVSLDKCPHVTDDAKAALESASRPPIQLVTIGADDREIKIGNTSVVTGDDGKASAKLRIDDAGSIILRAVTADSNGKATSDNRWVWVTDRSWDGGTMNWRGLSIVADKP